MVANKYRIENATILEILRSFVAFPQAISTTAFSLTLSDAQIASAVSAVILTPKVMPRDNVPVESEELFLTGLYTLLSSFSVIGFT